eukprot:81730_1
MMSSSSSSWWIFDFLASTRHTYPPVFLVATCLKACVDLRIAWEENSKNRQKTKESTDESDKVNTSILSNRPPVLYSIVFGLIGFAYAGSFCTNLLMFSRTPTMFLENVTIPVYVACWLVVNCLPYDACFILLRQPGLSLCLTVLSCFDSATNAMNLVVKTHAMHPATLIFPVVVGTFNPLAGRLMRCLEKKLNGESVDSDLSQPPAIFYLSLLNAVVYFMSGFDRNVFVLMTCFTVCVRVGLYDHLSHILALSWSSARCHASTWCSVKFHTCSHTVRTLFLSVSSSKKVD